MLASVLVAIRPRNPHTHGRKHMANKHLYA
jgi:hypothetical protein